jgi:PPK2 family polyphosphate:nucleotide phosphotransferase
MGDARNKEKNRPEKKHKLDHAPFLVSADKSIRLSDFDTAYTAGLKSKKEGREALLEDITDLAEAQTLLWANAQHSVLIILQAMDAAGKDGAIKHVMSGVNPQGVEVHAFKAPNDEELLHNFLWRPMRKMPARGRIVIFNRSYYEEVLVVRVHPKFLEKQFIPSRVADKPLEELWRIRYADINHFEQIANDNDVTVIKLFLNVSKEEQRERFLERLNNPEKNWKFSAADLRERSHWNEYQQAYEDMLNATSTQHAPWYVIPADHKWFARAAIADIITSRIRDLNLKPPQPTAEQLADLAVARKELNI